MSDISREFELSQVTEVEKAYREAGITRETIERMRERIAYIQALEDTEDGGCGCGNCVCGAKDV